MLVAVVSEPAILGNVLAWQWYFGETTERRTSARRLPSRLHVVKGHDRRMSPAYLFSSLYLYTSAQPVVSLPYRVLCQQSHQKSGRWGESAPHKQSNPRLIRRSRHRRVTDPLPPHEPLKAGQSRQPLKYRQHGLLVRQVPVHIVVVGK